MPDCADDYDGRRTGALATISADEVRAVLLDAAGEIGGMPLFKLEETLGITIVEELERSAQAIPGGCWLDDEEFAELVERIGLLLPKLPSRSSALVPLIRQLVASLRAMHVRAAGP